jgi:DnaJ-class molecular chaperone
MQAGETIVFTEACSETDEWERAGDLHLVIEEAENAHGWKRSGDKGQHLDKEVEINLSEALLGIRVRLDGHPGWEEGMYVDIPVGSFTGDIYTVVGMGMPMRGRVNQYGDLRLHIKMVPKLMERRLLSGEVVQSELSGVFKGGKRSVTADTEKDVVKELQLGVRGGN